MSWLNVGNIIDATQAEGPGLRFVVWVQGCLKRCRGCCNPDLLKIEPAEVMPSSEVVEMLRKAHKQHQLEGVTFLGGEPMLQAKGLADVAQAAQELGLSVMIFTGYLREEINEQDFAGSDLLLKHTDLLIDGEFEQWNLEDKRNWVGSKNQRFHYLTSRYTPDIETQPQLVTNEFRFNIDGTVIENGLPFKIVNLK